MRMCLTLGGGSRANIKKSKVRVAVNNQIGVDLSNDADVWLPLIVLLRVRLHLSDSIF
jgi:hypothetical protein